MYWTKSRGCCNLIFIYFFLSFHINKGCPTGLHAISVVSLCYTWVLLTIFNIHYLEMIFSSGVGNTNKCRNWLHVAPIAPFTREPLLNILPRKVFSSENNEHPTINKKRSAGN